MPGPYEGVHAFLFLYEADAEPPADVIAKLKKQLNKQTGPVFFAELFQGDFAGFAHIAQDDATELVDYANSTLFDAGVRSDYATEGRVFIGGGGPKGPKRKSPRYCAICRVKTNERPATVLQRIAEEFDDDEPFVGGSNVIGRFQLLIELGTDDEESLPVAVDRLRDVPGVHKMKVGIADTGEGSGDPSA